MNNKPQFRTLFCPILPWVGLLLVLITSCTTSPGKRPSPLTRDSTQIGKSSLTIEYSSPRVRDRTIWGDLVPYDQMWRTGANEATWISSSNIIQLDTFLINGGKYSIFTIPRKNSWEVIFNEDWEQWGHYDYKESLDAARLIVYPTEYSEKEENMRLYFENDSLKFRWEKLGWGIGISSIE